jgi:hypothetical protein
VSLPRMPIASGPRAASRCRSAHWLLGNAGQRTPTATAESTAASTGSVRVRPICVLRPRTRIAGVRRTADSWGTAASGCTTSTATASRGVSVRRAVISIAESRNAAGRTGSAPSSPHEGTAFGTLKSSSGDQDLPDVRHFGFMERVAVHKRARVRRYGLGPRHERRRSAAVESLMGLTTPRQSVKTKRRALR